MDLHPDGFHPISTRLIATPINFHQLPSSINLLHCHLDSFEAALVDKFSFTLSQAR
jgi:hypothetical protein